MTNSDIAMISAVASGLVTAVATLWRMVAANAARADKRAEVCERKHEDTLNRLIHVTEEIGDLRGRIDLAEQVTVKMRDLQRTVDNLVDYKLDKEHVPHGTTEHSATGGDS